MSNRLGFFLVFLLTLPLGPRAGASSLSAPSGSGVTLSNDRWSSVLAEFEESVLSGAKGLDKTKSDLQATQAEIAKLEGKVAALRRDAQGGSNVFGEIRLKSLLNDLKIKLEENSNLQHQWDEKQKEFEQKALSLTALYNERIEGELVAMDPPAELNRLDQKLDLLTALVQKRNQVQSLLVERRKKNDNEKLIPLSSFDPLKSHDRDNLQLTLDLFRDRKKDLTDRLEKWSLEEDQAKNEMKLQGKMQEFLEDIRQINEDSDLPRGGLKHNELEGVVGKSQKNKIEARVNDLHGKIILGQKNLAQLTELMERVQHQLDSLNERKSK